MLFFIPYYGYKIDFSEYLGGIQRNESGHIVAAHSTLLVWTTMVDPDQQSNKTTGLGIDFDASDPGSLMWEALMIEMLRNSSIEHQIQEVFDMKINVARRYDDI